MKTLRSPLVAAAVFSVLLHSSQYNVVGAQHIASSPETPLHAQAGWPCHEYTHVIDRVLLRNRAAHIFLLVGRAGRLDRSPAWNERRLHNLRQYMIEWSVTPDHVALRDLDPIQDNAVLEIHVDGMLAAVIDVSPNKDLPISFHCEGEHFGYYPNLDWWLRQHGQRQ